MRSVERTRRAAPGRPSVRRLGLIAALTALAASAAAAQETPRPTPTEQPGWREEHRAQAPDLTPEAVGEPTPKRVRVEFWWKRGINYQLVTPVHIGIDEYQLVHRDFTLSGRIGFRLQVDTAGYLTHGDLPPIGTAIEVRRFYFYTTGEMNLLRPVYFRVQFGIIDNSFYLDDFYFWLTDLPYVGTFKIGQFTAPMSLERLSGSFNTVLMEYGSPVEAFAPGSKTGVQLANTAFARRATWAAGLFSIGQTTDTGDSSQSVLSAVSRLTGLALEPDEAGEPLLHLGLSASYVFSNDEVRYRSRPESFLAPHVVDTGDIDVNNAFLLGGELALIRGPFSAQAEYLSAFLVGDAVDRPIFGGVYVLGSWILTGETRPYDRTAGAFTGLRPAHPFAPCEHTWGAWELAARYSSVDLTSGGVRGGRMHGATLGINWYWSENVRWMFNTNYENVSASPQDGHVFVFQARGQVQF
jgi:phosphate-selective porin OprO and OprP